MEKKLMEAKELHDQLAQKLQRNILDAPKDLLEIARILNELNIPFALAAGTCLGAIRNNRIIPWDHDIDIYIFSEHFRIEVLESFKKAGFVCFFWGGVQVSTKQPFYAYTALARRFWSNILILYHRDGKRAFHRGIQRFVPFPAELFTQPKEITFLGEKFLVPNPPETYLEIRYGNKWLIPRRKWRQGYNRKKCPGYICSPRIFQFNSASEAERDIAQLARELLKEK